ncbi:hypothetical protein IMY05_003G0090600 [Salix suchowensis]|nr:hypothetical protein IMY05_003G0090600 [Salix suchowensis]
MDCEVGAGNVASHFCPCGCQQGIDLEEVMSSAPGWIESCEIAVEGAGNRNI